MRDSVDPRFRKRPPLIARELARSEAERVADLLRIPGAQPRSS